MICAECGKEFTGRRKYCSRECMMLAKRKREKIQSQKGNRGIKATRMEDQKKYTTGQKFDDGKQPWFAMPLEVLQPLADVFAAGEKKYEIFNCLERFDDPSRRFYDASMRHLSACQIDSLAIDQELKEKYGVEVYHAAQVAFSILMRLHHCRQERSNGK
jgi:hypothetical protein